MRILAAWAIGCCAAFGAGSAGAAAAAPPAYAAAVAPAFAQPSLNVFRRFAPPIRARMIDFYGQAIGLSALQPIQLTAAQQIILFRVGTSGQIKLAAGLTPGRQYRAEGVDAATGIRLLTFRVADEAAAVARFRAAGFPAPAFHDAGGRRVARVLDPGGMAIDLVADPATATPAGVTVGIAVNDLPRSRAFYRRVTGLEELPPVQDAASGRTLYPFRHGETTLTLWQAPRGVPADTGSAGIQYVIANIDAVNAAALADGVTVETPLGGVAGFNVRTVWFNDPDGVTNYFYQLGAK